MPLIDSRYSFAIYRDNNKITRCFSTCVVHHIRLRLGLFAKGRIRQEIQAQRVAHSVKFVTLTGGDAIKFVFGPRQRSSIEKKIYTTTRTTITLAPCEPSGPTELGACVVVVSHLKINSEKRSTHRHTYTNTCMLYGCVCVHRK